jgi:pyruvate,water dikinase
MRPGNRVVWLKDVKRTDVAQVGGKNASLGELISAMQEQLNVPPGFATTAPFEPQKNSGCHEFLAPLLIHAMRRAAVALAQRHKAELRLIHAVPPHRCLEGLFPSRQHWSSS